MPDVVQPFVARDRAKRVAFRLATVRRDRASAWAGADVGMSTLVVPGADLAAVAQDVQTTIEDLVAGRARDREHPYAIEPLAACLDGVLDRVELARRIEVAALSAGASSLGGAPYGGARAGGGSSAHGAPGVPSEAGRARFLALLDDAVRRLGAFAAVVDEERPVPEPATVDVARVVARVEDDAAADPARASTATAPGTASRAVTGDVPSLRTFADGLEDLLRAARAEVPDAPPPWRATREPGPPAAVALALGAPVGAGEATPPSPLAGPPPGHARTDRAVRVLLRVHGASVARATDAEGATVGVVVRLEDPAGARVTERLATGVRLSPVADAAARAYVLARDADDDPTSPRRLAATLGVFRAVEAELTRVLRPLLASPGARTVAATVPREATRKAPLRRSVAEALAGAVPDVVVAHADETLAAVAAGRVPPAALRPPDAAVAFLVFGLETRGPEPFGARLAPLDAWSPDEVVFAARACTTLGALRAALDAGRDPGPDWPARLEVALDVLALLSRVG